MPEPKFRTISSFIERGIRSGRLRPGMQIPTEMSLVEKFGVSRPTVTRAMLDLTNQGLIERKAGSGSFVRDMGWQSRPLTLGIVVAELGLGDVFDPIAAQIARRAQQLEFGLFLGDTGNRQLHARDALGRLDVSLDDAERACESFVRREVSGVFFTPIASASPADETNERILSMFRGAGIAVVLIDRDVECFPRRSNYDLVAIDHLVGQYLAADHLIDAGCRRLAYLQWPGASDSLAKRIAGANVCLSQHDGVDASMTVVAGDPRDLGLIRQILETHKPDAMMCENDLIAAHLIQSLSQLKQRVPDDLCVVGFNDVPLAQHLETPLTTIRQPCQDIGDAAVEVMRWRLENRAAPPRTVTLAPTLIERSSVRTASCISS